MWAVSRWPTANMAFGSSWTSSSCSQRWRAGWPCAARGTSKPCQTAGTAQLQCRPCLEDPATRPHTMNIVVNEELKAYIDPLTPEEHDALERSILAEGCRDALVLWGDVLVDGHNRYGICQKHGLPFQTVQKCSIHFCTVSGYNHFWLDLWCRCCITNTICYANGL